MACARSESLIGWELGVRPLTALWERKPEQGETSVLVRSASLLVAFHATENDVAVPVLRCPVFRS